MLSNLYVEMCEDCLGCLLFTHLTFNDRNCHGHSTFIGVAICSDSLWILNSDNSVTIKVLAKDNNRITIVPFVFFI